MKVLYKIIIWAVIAALWTPIAFAQTLDQALDRARKSQVASADLDKLLAAGYQRNTAPEVMAGYIELITGAHNQGLPTGPLASKVVEGMAKRAPSFAINSALERKINQYRFVRSGLEKTYARFGRKVEPTNTEMEMLSDVLAMGVTESELDNFLQKTTDAEPDNLVRSAMFMAAMKQSGITATDSINIALKGLRSGSIYRNGWEMARLVKTAGRKGASGSSLARSAGRMVSGQSSMNDFQNEFGISSNDLAAGPQMAGPPREAGKGPMGQMGPGNIPGHEGAVSPDGPGTATDNMGGGHGGPNGPGGSGNGGPSHGSGSPGGGSGGGSGGGHGGGGKHGAGPSGGAIN